MPEHENPFRELVRGSGWTLLGSYIAAAWICFEVVHALTQGLELPHWFPKLAVALLFLGLPAVLALEWLRRKPPVSSLISTYGDPLAPARSRHPLFTARSRLVLMAVVICFAVWGLVAAGWLALRQPAPDVERQTVRRMAVLPFENLGDSGDDARFTDGTTAEVRGKLIELSGLEVTAPASSNEYRRTTKTWPAIGQELGVQYLLSGTVRWERGGGGELRVRVSPTLIQASTGALVWQDAFDAALTDVFEVQTRIAERVVQALDLALSGNARRQLAMKSTANLTAYSAYLRGEEVSQGLVRNDPTTLRQAVDYYTQAIALDSSFVQAWARLSQAYSRLYLNSTPTPSRAQQALEAARRAMKLDPDRPEGHLALGMYYLSVALSFPRALRELEQAEKTAPSDTDVLRHLGYVKENLGRWEDALADLQKAQRLDPRSAATAKTVAEALLWLRRYPEAREAADRALALAPGTLENIENRAMICLAEGNLAEARAVLSAAAQHVDRVELAAFFAYYWDLPWVLGEEEQRLVLGLSPSAFDGDQGMWGMVLAQTYALRGDRARSRVFADSARVAFEEHLKTSPDDPQQHVLLGLAFAYLGRKNEAVREGRRGVALLPTGEAALLGGYLQHQLARIYILIGEPDQALDQLEPLLQRPHYLSSGWLRVDPNFDPVRNSPRFKRLIAGGV